MFNKVARQKMRAHGVALGNQPNLIRSEKIAAINRRARFNYSTDWEILLVMMGRIMRPISLPSGRDELLAG